MKHYNSIRLAYLTILLVTASVLLIMTTIPLQRAAAAPLLPNCGVYQYSGPCYHSYQYLGGGCYNFYDVHTLQYYYGGGKKEAEHVASMWNVCYWISQCTTNCTGGDTK